MVAHHFVCSVDYCRIFLKESWWTMLRLLSLVGWRVEAIFLAIFLPLAKFPPQTCALLM